MSSVSDACVVEQLRDSGARKLDSLNQVHPTARMQGKAGCCQSGICCWRRPGEISEEDIPKLAQGLGISEQELFQKYLLVDRIRGILFLRLRRRHEPAGCMLGWLATWSMESPCVFLDETNGNACQVHSFKPTACRKYKCWERSNMQSITVSEEGLHALGWDGYDPDRDDETLA
jgi:Fe-S-cluster containining protein